MFAPFTVIMLGLRKIKCGFDFYEEVGVRRRVMCFVELVLLGSAQIRD